MLNALSLKVFSHATLQRSSYTNYCFRTIVHCFLHAVQFECVPQSYLNPEMWPISETIVYTLESLCYLPSCCYFNKVDTEPKVVTEILCLGD